jgi:hypothetical protein
MSWNAVGAAMLILPFLVLFVVIMKATFEKWWHVVRFFAIFGGMVAWIAMGVYLMRRPPSVESSPRPTTTEGVPPVEQHPAAAVR